METQDIITINVYLLKSSAAEHKRDYVAKPVLCEMNASEVGTDFEHFLKEKIEKEIVRPYIKRTMNKSSEWLSSTLQLNINLACARHIVGRRQGSRKERVSFDIFSDGTLATQLPYLQHQRNTESLATLKVHHTSFPHLDSYFSIFV